MQGRLTAWFLVAGIAGSAFAAVAVSGPVAAAAPAKPYVVSARTVSVKGHDESVLANASGRTLYYFTKDSATKVACTAACAKLWPPLVLKSGTVVGARGVTGKFTIVTDPNGRQVAYNGHPLYTFSSDKKPGQATGQGFKGLWWVATPVLTAAVAPVTHVTKPTKAPAKAGATTKTKVTVTKTKAPVRTAAYVVVARTAAVKGHDEAILTNAAGMTLYYFTNDTATKTACTGACAKLWPPLVVKSGTVVGGKGVTGKFTIVTDPNGRQVAYNGHQLYTFSSDKKAGQTLGEGFKHLWWVATPSLQASSAKKSAA